MGETKELKKMDVASFCFMKVFMNTEVQSLNVNILSMKASRRLSVKRKFSDE